MSDVGIRLRKLVLSDAEPMLKLMKNPAIYEKMQYNHEEQTLEKCRAFIENSWSDVTNLHYAITDDTDAYLGTISLKNIDEKNGNAELAIVICPERSGQGVGGYAVEKLLEVAFFERNLHKVYLYVRSDNERAVNFYKKIGMEYEGCFREHLYINGAF